MVRIPLLAVPGVIILIGSFMLLNADYDVAGFVGLGVGAVALLIGVIKHMWRRDERAQW